jgi:hypothetical protein
MIETHQRIAFDALFQASRETLEEMAANERYLGGNNSPLQLILHLNPASAKRKISPEFVHLHFFARRSSKPFR